MNSNRLIRSAVCLAGLLALSLFAANGVLEQSVQANDETAQIDPSVDASETVPAELNEAIVTAQNQFGFNLFNQLRQTESGNLLISPSSIALALSMTYNGAAGDTQAAIAETLALQGISLEQLNQSSAALIQTLQNADPAVTLSIANSLWGRQDISFHPDFLQRSQTFYGAEVNTLDFSDPAAADRINTWVSEHTEGKIPQIIDQISPDQVMFLINAIYFKGSWTEPFDPETTRDRPFYLADGSETQVPMMAQRGQYRYLETDEFQAISLPYGEGKLSFYVFLPKQGLSQWLDDSLTAETWNTWMGQFRSVPGTIQLPRFTLEYETQLNDTLKALGMEPAFDPRQADFSNLSDASTFINEVKHKTFMEVNEEGTEAAAATSVGIALTSAPIVSPFQMTVDRPFLAAIRDDQSGAILFLGTIEQP